MLTTAFFFIYLSISAYITIHVGKILFRNGRHFLLQMLNDKRITDAVNKILLTGYYIVNLGYVSIMFSHHSPILTPSDLIASLASSIGHIMLMLACLHYINISVAILWNKIKFKL